MGAGNSNDAAEANRLGLDSLRSGDARSAAAHFDRACRADPAAGELRINLATAHRLLGDDEAERAALEAALAIDQRNLMALVRLAQLHERLGEEGPAVQGWSAVLTLGRTIEEPSPELVQLLGHARSYVERQREGLAGALEAALAGELAVASARARRRVRAAADVMLGRRTVFANECHGLHYPFLPADEFFDREQFPWLETLEAATADIKSELEAILADRDPGLTPYVEQPSGVPENKWTPLDKSLDWGALHLWRNGERQEAACARAPKTAGARPGIRHKGNVSTKAAVLGARAQAASIRSPSFHKCSAPQSSDLSSGVHLFSGTPDGCST